MLSAPMIGGEAEVEIAESERKFHDDLLNGLHALAQPLTVLRAAVEMLARPAAAGMDQKHYLEISAAQVARTCDLFSCVCELVTSNVKPATLASFDLWELLMPVIEDQNSRLQGMGVGLAVVHPEPWQPIVGDAERTEQAFRALLKTSTALAAHGDVIEIHTAHRQGFAEITLKNPRSHGKRLSSSDRLGLAMAEISILSQHGSYRCEDDPFCCRIALPVQEAAHPSFGGQPRITH